jgi:hypothetical protein
MFDVSVLTDGVKDRSSLFMHPAEKEDDKALEGRE